MKRFMICLGFILLISACLSFFIKAEEKPNNYKPIEKQTASNIMVDNEIKNLEFFSKNINAILTYKEMN